MGGTYGPPPYGKDDIDWIRYNTQQAVELLQRLVNMGGTVPVGAAVPSPPTTTAGTTVDLTPLISAVQGVTSAVQRLAYLLTPQGITVGSLTGVAGTGTDNPGGLLAQAYIPKADGSINIVIAVNSGSSGVTLQMSVDGGTTYDDTNILAGGSLSPGSIYQFPVAVKEGWAVQFAPSGTGTTNFDVFAAWFVPSQGVET